MDPHRHKATNFWNATDSTPPLVKANTTGRRLCLTSVDVSSTVAATVTITFGTTDVLVIDFSGAFTWSKVFPPGEYTGAEGEDLTIAVSAGTAKANAAGYEFIG